MQEVDVFYIILHSDDWHFINIYVIGFIRFWILVLIPEDGGWRPEGLGEGTIICMCSCKLLVGIP